MHDLIDEAQSPSPSKHVSHRLPTDLGIPPPSGDQRRGETPVPGPPGRRRKYPALGVPNLCFHVCIQVSWDCAIYMEIHCMRWKRTGTGSRRAAAASSRCAAPAGRRKGRRCGGRGCPGPRGVGGGSAPVYYLRMVMYISIDAILCIDMFVCVCTNKTTPAYTYKNSPRPAPAPSRARRW